MTTEWTWFAGGAIAATAVIAAALLVAALAFAIGARAGDDVDDDSGDYEPPAAGMVSPPATAGRVTAPATPQPGQPGQAASPPPAPGNEYGRWLKSIDVFENATVITDWAKETHEVFPASFDPGTPS